MALILSRESECDSCDFACIASDSNCAVCGPRRRSEAPGRDHPPSPMPAHRGKRRREVGAWCRQCGGIAGTRAAQPFWNGYCPACWETKCCVCDLWRPGLSKIHAGACDDLVFDQGWLCHKCLDDGVTLEEVQFLLLLPLFRIWSQGRREDSTCREAGPIPPQPCRVGRYLYLGDLDDATDTTKLRALNIRAVLCLCPERLDPATQIRLERARSQGVRIRTLQAYDDSNYDILSTTWPIAETLLRRWIDAGAVNILIVCWGGVNRSAVIAGAWLRTAEGFGFPKAMEILTRARGTVLTNMAFRRALLALSR